MVSIARWIILLGMAGAASAFAHDGVGPRSEADLHAPGVFPDRVILTWTGDPAHTQDVTWRTDTTGTRAFAEIARSEPGPEFVKQTLRVTGTTRRFESDLGVAHYHSVHFEGLLPGTKYAYRVGGDPNWSEWFQFTTPRVSPAPLTFVYFGDSQNDLRSLWSRVIREAHADAPRSTFFLHAGDLVNQGDADREWGEWFGAGAWLNAMIPNVVVTGNHEYVRRAGGESSTGRRERRLTEHWRTLFALPTHGPTGLEETVFWLDVQGVRLIALNSNEEIERQVPWLERVLSDNPNRWTIVSFHHPVFSSAKGRDNPELRAAWKPLFDRFRVDLVLTGHDHTYARSGLEVPENLASGERLVHQGTVYVVSVSGPKMYPLATGAHMKRAAEGIQLYQVIRIDGDRLAYEARDATGELYDAFLLRKRARGANQLIERVPKTPERRPSE